MDPQTEMAVNNFFNNLSDNDVVYATPGTDNYSANFYGDTPICALTKDDVFNAIESASGWGLSEEATVEAILSDLQYDRPEDE